MQEVIDEKRKGLLRECWPYFVWLGLAILIYAGIAAVFWIFETRETYLWYAFGGAATLSLTIFFCYFVASYRIAPRMRLRRFLKGSLYTNVYRQDATFLRKDGEETYQGVLCERLLFSLGQEGKESLFLIEKGGHSFVEGASYVLYSHDHFILRDEKA